MRLYGNDIDETTTPVEADLEWIVGWHKGEFNGAAVLREQKERGAERKLIGFELLDAGYREAGPRRLRRRHEGRNGDQRHAHAVSEEGHRYGVRVDRPCRPGGRDRRSTSAAGGPAPASCRCRFTNAPASPIPTQVPCRGPRADRCNPSEEPVNQSQRFTQKTQRSPRFLDVSSGQADPEVRTEIAAASSNATTSVRHGSG